MPQKKKAKFETGCWIWPYGVKRDGYGSLQINNVSYETHKWMFEIIKGKVPKGLELDHLCRNRNCLNPEHLEMVSHAENCRRGANTKLNTEKVAEIRKQFGKKTRKELAVEYGVSHTTIGKIHKGTTWNDARAIKAHINNLINPGV